MFNVAKNEKSACLNGFFLKIANYFTSAPYFAAIVSISMAAPIGKSLTAYVDLAG